MDIDVYWPLGGGARCGCRCRCRILFVKLSSTTIPNMPCIRSHGGSSQNFFSNGNNPTDLNASIHIALTLQRLVTRPGVSQLGAPPGMAVLCQPRPLSLTPHEILDFVRPIPVVGRNDSSCSRLYHYRVRPLDRRSHQALEEKIGQWGHVPNESEELLNFLLTIARGGQPQSRIIPQGRPRPYPNSEQVRRLNDARDAPAMMMQSQAPPGTLANVPSTTPQSNPIPIKSGLPESFHYNVAPQWHNLLSPEKGLILLNSMLAPTMSRLPATQMLLRNSQTPNLIYCGRSFLVLPILVPRSKEIREFH